MYTLFTTYCMNLYKRYCIPLYCVVFELYCICLYCTVSYDNYILGFFCMAQADRLADRAERNELALNLRWFHVTETPPEPNSHHSHQFFVDPSLCMSLSQGANLGAFVGKPGRSPFSPNI